MKASYQTLFFDELLRQMNRPTLIQMIQSVLDVSKSTAYNYLNDQSDLSYNEMRRLQDNEIIANLMQNHSNATSPGYVDWKYLPLEFERLTPTVYLNRIYEYLSLLEPAKSRVFSSTFEVPLFYYMGFPKLFAFKLYAWSQTIWQNLTPSDKFHPEYLKEANLTSLVQQIYARFLTLPTVEYWTETILDNTIKQIIYFRDMDAFISRLHYLDLIKDLHRLTDYIGSMIDELHKFDVNNNQGGGTMAVAFNQIYFNSNIYLIESLNHKMVFTSCDNPNFLITNDKRMFAHLKKWHLSMQDNSTPLTGNTALVKKSFLDSLRLKLDELG